ncbi:MAG: hypothetical protein ACXADH_10595 [Candidatus Kariarchaeaceae archaeon]|jgi:hypothetical protein
MPGRMFEYEGLLFQVDARPNDKFYCRIYQHDIPKALNKTDDYDTEEEAMEAAKEVIREIRGLPAE